MQLKIFVGFSAGDLEGQINEFLRDLPKEDIHLIQTEVTMNENYVAFIWLRTDAPTEEEIRMNNIGSDPASVKEFEWFCENHDKWLPSERK